MPEVNLLQKFERRLVELGCPAARTRRAVHEMADHYEDLKHAAQEEGYQQPRLKLARKSIWANLWLWRSKRRRD